MDVLTDLAAVLLVTVVPPVAVAVALARPRPWRPPDRLPSRVKLNVAAYLEQVRP